MIRSLAIVLLAALSVHSFTPSTSFGARRHVFVAPSQHVAVRMSSPMLDEKVETPTETVNGANVTMIEKEEELSETQKLMKQVKEAGTAGILSYALWELGFWAFSVPVCVFGYREVTGHWPDLSNKEDLEKLGAEAFAFVNFARFAVPLRIGLALSTTPWIQKNIIDRFQKNKEESSEQ
jgi:hypothetical protein